MFLPFFNIIIEKNAVQPPTIQMRHVQQANGDQNSRVYCPNFWDERNGRFRVPEHGAHWIRKRYSVTDTIMPVETVALWKLGNSTLYYGKFGDGKTLQQVFSTAAIPHQQLAMKIDESLDATCNFISI